jgi:hypothetical protein
MSENENSVLTAIGSAGLPLDKLSSSADRCKTIARGEMKRGKKVPNQQSQEFIAERPPVRDVRIE